MRSLLIFHFAHKHSIVAARITSTMYIHIWKWSNVILSRNIMQDSIVRAICSQCHLSVLMLRLFFTVSICHAQSIEVKSKRPYEDAFSRIIMDTHTSHILIVLVNYHNKFIGYNLIISDSAVQKIRGKTWGETWQASWKVIFDLNANLNHPAT